MIEDTIQKAEGTGKLTVDEIEQLMSITDKNEMEELFAAARRVREKEFGKKIFTYGFVYFSTYCRNNCSFCIFRHSNDELGRYRKSVEEIVQLSAALQDSGINLSDLTMGEDPYMIANDYEKFLEIVSAVKDQVGISIMASPGAMPQHMFTKVRDAGADFYACYQETYNRNLFESLRLNQSFDDRRNQKIWAMQAGLLAEDGMMIGLGENVRDRAETIAEMSSLGCGQIRAMTFVPQPNTPMQDYVQYDSTDELKAIAVMRLVNHDILIPCSLDVEGFAGFNSRLDAGANVITSIIPPSKNLAGVAQHEMDIENGNRSVAHVMEMLDKKGLRHATDAEYRAHLSAHRPKRVA
ncbi:pyrrolysine biosynthesis radical SAM protein PylB [methanogenic archaeon mixed culture ISO4-G1]|nr:pyrrolysine biosynthesis radical SAM protein PylB [methanogenic archaeon mixed culture ISO4-G1]